MSNSSVASDLALCVFAGGNYSGPARTLVPPLSKIADLTVTTRSVSLPDHRLKSVPQC